MKQALKLGAFLRETYVDDAAFLPPTLGSGSEPSFSSKFMSDSGEWGGTPPLSQRRSQCSLNLACWVPSPSHAASLRERDAVDHPVEPVTRVAVLLAAVMNQPTCLHVPREGCRASGFACTAIAVFFLFS